MKKCRCVNQSGNILFDNCSASLLQRLDANERTCYSATLLYSVCKQLQAIQATSYLPIQQGTIIPSLLPETYIEAYGELRVGDRIGDRGGLTPTLNRQLPDRHSLEWGCLIKGALIKMESTRKLSNFNFQWTNTLYQNNLKNIANFTRIVKTQVKLWKFHV